MNSIILSDNYYDNPKTDNDFIQISIDVYGDSIRDNTRLEKIEIGKNYHFNGGVTNE